jgi:hypothetical protein
MGRILTLQTMAKRAVLPAPVLADETAAANPAAPEPATSTPPTQVPITPHTLAATRLPASRRLPPRDASGAVVGVVEVAAATTPDQRERFRSLAVALHQRWFLERPAPFLDASSPSASRVAI